MSAKYSAERTVRISDLRRFGALKHQSFRAPFIFGGENPLNAETREGAPEEDSEYMAGTHYAPFPADLFQRQEVRDDMAYLLGVGRDRMYSDVCFHHVCQTALFSGTHGMKKIIPNMSGTD